MHDDGWTAVTADGSLSAHFEHSVAITDDGPDDLDRVSRTGSRSERHEGPSIGQEDLRKCKVIRRQGVVRVICENPRHKQRQG